MSELLSYVLLTVLEIIPLWKIFRKTGQSPALSFFVIVPLVV